MVKARSRSGGFSLVETIIAMVVIVIALFAILTVTVYTSTTEQAQKELETAKEAASRKLDEIRGLPWGGMSNITIPSVVNSYATVATPVTFAVSGLSKSQGQVIVHGTNPFPLTDPVLLVDLEVLITWSGVRGTSRFSMRTMMTKDQMGN
jgi:hypothetical protein